MTQLKINSKVTWKSAAGVLTGTITDIYLALNGNRELIPFLIIDIEKGNDRLTGSSARMCGTDGYLKMMHFELVEESLVAA